MELPCRACTLIADQRIHGASRPVQLVGTVEIYEPAEGGDPIIKGRCRVGVRLKPDFELRQCRRPKIHHLGGFWLCHNHWVEAEDSEGAGE